MPVDPDATGAPRESGALVEDPPRPGEADTAAIEHVDPEPEAPAALEPPRRPVNDKKPPRTRERQTVSSPGSPAPARRSRMEARKVHRLVRHIEPWSVLKVSLIFFFCIWVILLTSAVILWKVASSSGVIDNVESFIEEIFALDSFSFEASQMFRAYAVGGLVMVVAATGFTVLLAVLFNLISDLTGGVRLTVVEEESARYVEPAAAPVSTAAPTLSPGLTSGNTAPAPR